MPHGESIQNFCVRNKVPYNIFSKWYKDTRKKIVEVKVDGMPTDKETLPSAPGEAPASVPASSSPVRIFEQWASYQPEEPNLPRTYKVGRETGGLMLSVTGLNHFYYVRDFTDMRCKHSRILLKPKR